MKSPSEKHSGLLLVFGIIIGALGLMAGPALAALSFSSTTISGDGAVVIDGPGTISIGTSTATAVTIGNDSTTVTMGSEENSFDPEFPSGDFGLDNTSIGVIGGANFTPWVGLGVQAEQLNESSGIAAINATSFVKLPDGDTSAIGVNANLYLDLGADGTNDQTANESLVDLIGSGHGKAWAYYADISQDGSGTANTLGGMNIGPVFVDSGAVTNGIGLEIDDQTQAINNWAIKTGLGKVSFGDVVQIATSTFSGLPTCNSGEEGTQHPVTDAATSTYGATITGGGSSHVLAYCDGTNWTVMAK